MVAKDALLAQHMDHARQISELHAVYQRERTPVPASGGHNDVATLTNVPSAPACGGEENTGGAEEDGETGETLPAIEKAHELLVLNPACNLCKPG